MCEKLSIKRILKRTLTLEGLLVNVHYHLQAWLEDFHPYFTGDGRVTLLTLYYGFLSKYRGILNTFDICQYYH